MKRVFIIVLVLTILLGLTTSCSGNSEPEEPEEIEITVSNFDQYFKIDKQPESYTYEGYTYDRFYQITGKQIKTAYHLSFSIDPIISIQITSPVTISIRVFSSNMKKVDQEEISKTITLSSSGSYSETFQDIDFYALDKIEYYEIKVTDVSGAIRLS